MSEHARRNLVCSSWHKAPEGHASWGGNTSGWTARPFCWDQAGHPGDHWAMVSPGTWVALDPDSAMTTMFMVSPGTWVALDPDSAMTTMFGRKAEFEQTTRQAGKQKRMTWPNKLGIPAWLSQTTFHGIQMMRAHGMSDDAILAGGSD